MNDYNEFLSQNNMNEILKSQYFSESKLEKIRSLLTDLVNTHYSEYANNFTIITTGSYARKEASIESDLDCFIVIDDYNKSKNLPKKMFEDITNRLKEVVQKDTGTTNTFTLESAKKYSQIIQLNHPEESNAEFTRRVLMLLEGEYLYNEELFLQLRKKIIEEYLKGQEYKFILNDFARYHRTILTDFHYKIYVGDKSWGVRSTKLKFSRKLIYVSGLIAIAHADISNEKLEDLFSMNPLERIYYIGKQYLKETDDTVKIILENYNVFLNKLSDYGWRKRMDGMEREERTDSKSYIQTVEVSRKFSEACISFLKALYADERCNIQEAALIL